MIPRTGHRPRRETPRPLFVLAEAAATIARGDLVTENASGRLEVAGDGDHVFGVADTEASSGENVWVQVSGVRELDTTASPGFSKRWDRVVAAGSNQVDAGSAGDPWFASLLEFRSSAQRARVVLHPDAIKACARSLRTQSDETISIGEITEGRPWVRTSGRLETPRTAGTTAQRPGASSRYDGMTYYDTDVEALLVWRDSLGAWVGPTNRLAIEYARGATITSFVLRYGATDMGWTNSPWSPARAITVARVGITTKGTVGSETWTFKLRKNGVATDLWTKAIVSATSWAQSVDAVGVSFVAGDRIQFRADASGSGEGIQALLDVEYFVTY